MPDLISRAPHSGEWLDSFASMDRSSLFASLLRSENAFYEWSRTPVQERAVLLHRIHDKLGNQKGALARLAALEMGKPLKEGIAEIEKCQWLCKYYAEEGVSMLADEIVVTEAQQSFVRIEPLGSILGIMPWNYPYWQAFRFLIPTILTGNTVLLKHASNVTGCAFAMESLVAESGISEGVFQVLPIQHDDVAYVIASPLIHGVSLTGSEKAGTQVASLAGKYLKPSLLELGGSNAFIVLDDAHPQKAASLAVKARFQNTGQSCIAAKRIIVTPGIYPAFMEAFLEGVSQLTIGDPLGDFDLGPMAREDLAKELEQQVNDSLKAGARLELGGVRKGAFFSPTVLSGVQPGMKAFEEELFGPVAAVVKAKNQREAIELSNRSSFGLGVTICTSQTDEIMANLEVFRDGAVFINEMVKSDPRLPFGGIKKSGFGRELGKHGLHAFANVKTVYRC